MAPRAQGRVPVGSLTELWAQAPRTTPCRFERWGSRGHPRGGYQRRSPLAVNQEKPIFPGNPQLSLGDKPQLTFPYHL